MDPDPRFPNRPTHRDFDLLSKIAIEHDENAEKALERLRNLVDTDSLNYLAQQRALIVLDALEDSSTMNVVVKLAIIDGFFMGYEFARRELVQTEDDWIAPDGSHRTKE